MLGGCRLLLDERRLSVDAIQVLVAVSYESSLETSWLVAGTSCTTGAGQICFLGTQFDSNSAGFNDNTSALPRPYQGVKDFGMQGLNWEVQGWNYGA